MATRMSKLRYTIIINNIVYYTLTTLTGSYKWSSWIVLIVLAIVLQRLSYSRLIKKDIVYIYFYEFDLNYIPSEKIASWNVCFIKLFFYILHTPNRVTHTHHTYTCNTLLRTFILIRTFFSPVEHPIPSINSIRRRMLLTITKIVYIPV